jgi:hypothetical protein
MGTQNLLKDIIKYVQGSNSIYLRLKMTFTTEDKVPVSATKDQYLHIDRLNKEAFLALLNSGCLSQRLSAAGQDSKTKTEFQTFSLPSVPNFDPGHQAL